MLEQFKTQHQKHYTNDAEELKRYDLYKKSKANVVKLNALNHEPVFGITSMSNSMMIKGKNIIMKERIWINPVTSEVTLQPLEPDTDTSKLHDERIIAVREEPNLHIVFYQKDVPDEIRTPWKLPCRRGVKESLLEWTCCARTRRARTEHYEYRVKASVV